METPTAVYQGNSKALRMVGFVTAATVAGGIGGVVLYKIVLAAKGTTLIHAALAGPGGLAKAATSSLPALLRQGSATVGEAAKMLKPVTANAGINSLASMLRQTVPGGIPLSDKASALLQTLSRNAVPLTAGALGGGASGSWAASQMTKRWMRNMQDELLKQVTPPDAAQTAEPSAPSSQTGAETHASASQSRLETSSASALASVPRSSAQASLTDIKGIGQVYAQRLNAAGIYTFADLAAQTPDAVRNIIGTLRGGAIHEPEEWIEEARQRSGAA